MPKTLLLADDNDDLRSLLAYQLQQKGFLVIMASDGAQVLEKTKQGKPDLIILDILMPGVDGTETASILKADPATSGIPIIFLTALIQGNEPSQTATGEGIVLPKSIGFSILVEKIQEALG